jgi:non-specific serine/threonine protein kinase
LPWKEADAFFDWGNALVEIHDFAGAEEKFDAAIEVYHRIEAGQPWIDRVIAERARAVSAAKVTPERAPDRKVFREQGDYWAISFDGAEFNLRDTKGLHYLAHLLRNPDEQVSAIDLAALESASDSAKPQRTVDLGDAGEVLDAKARNEYRRRLEELREEIARTRRMNDVGAAERAEAEYEELTEHLSAAAGLGGRIRRTGSHRERARVAVTRSIRSSIESIRLSSPSMSRHLTSSIRTGHFCRYSPALPTVWQF